MFVVDEEGVMDRVEFSRHLPGSRVDVVCGGEDATWYAVHEEGDRVLVYPLYASLERAEVDSLFDLAFELVTVWEGRWVDGSPGVLADRFENSFLESTPTLLELISLLREWQENLDDERAERLEAEAHADESVEGVTGFVYHAEEGSVAAFRGSYAVVEEIVALVESR